MRAETSRPPSTTGRERQLRLRDGKPGHGNSERGHEFQVMVERAPVTRERIRAKRLYVGLGEIGAESAGEPDAQLPVPGRDVRTDRARVVVVLGGSLQSVSERGVVGVEGDLPDRDFCPLGGLDASELELRVVRARGRRLDALGERSAHEAAMTGVPEREMAVDLTVVQIGHRRRDIRLRRLEPRERWLDGSHSRGDVRGARRRRGVRRDRSRIDRDRRRNLHA